MTLHFAHFILMLHTVVLLCEPSEKKHFLTFIMPCYNCQETVRESIDSIYNQDLPIPFEVICTDDGSTDSTPAILESYKKKYQNFRVYFHQKNKGGGAARNTCVSHAKGDLLFNLDSDNVLVKNSVYSLVKLLDSSGCDAAAFEEVRFFKDNYFPIDSWFFKSPTHIIDLSHMMTTYKTPGQDGNYLYTKKSYLKAKGYPEYGHSMDAWGFGFRQHATGTKIVILPHSFYWHRFLPNCYSMREMRGGTNTQPCWKMSQEYLEIFTPQTITFILETNPNNNFFSAIENKQLRLVESNILEHLFLAYEYQNTGNIHLAIEEYVKAIECGGNTQEIHKKITALEDSRM